MGYFVLVLTIAVCLCIAVMVVKKPVIALAPLKYKGKPVQVESFWAVALTIPVVLMAVGAITPSMASKGILSDQGMNPIKILVLFMSMCFISVMLDKAGFFEYCALKVMSLSSKGQSRLFVMFYAVVAILTVFTSNDIIILTFTPFIYYFSKNTEINPIPYIVAEFVAANTWSLVLIVGNPTNIYIASSMGITFIEYVKVMALPGMAAGLSSFLILYMIFRKSLKEPLKGGVFEKPVLKDRTMALWALADLALCMIVLTVGSYINVEMWFISLLFALLLLIVALVINLYRKNKRDHNHNQQYVNLKDVFGGLPYSVVPFLLSMFIAMQAMDLQGITRMFSDLLFSVTDSPLREGMIFGFSSALSSNVINNIPMSLLFTNILNSGAAGSYHPVAIYASIIGSNIGAFFSPIGALAGVMFMKILKDKESNFSALTFIKYCAPVAIVSLVASVLVLVFVLT